MEWNGTSFVAGDKTTPYVLGGITDHTDVNTSGVTSGQVLEWNGTSWVAGDKTTPYVLGGITDHTDVDTSGVTSGQVLEWNGTSWVAVTKQLLLVYLNIPMWILLA